MATNVFVHQGKVARALANDHDKICVRCCDTYRSFFPSLSDEARRGPALAAGRAGRFESALCILPLKSHVPT